MKKRENTDDEYLDIEDLKRYISLSTEKKLIYLQEANRFFSEAVPPETKEAWEILRKEGW
ncbi:MAG: hypothetical protein JW932_17290 [Deltaproteobacteria bacterium]|nr:hypothetical protein [Deltaproteobacteria bacterium]